MIATLGAIAVWGVRSIRVPSERTRFALIAGMAFAPVVLALFASGVRLYPYGEVRLMAFAFPGLAFLIGSALAEAVPGGRTRAIGIAACAVFLFFYFRNGILRESYAHIYMGVYDQREDFDCLASWSKPGDTILISKDDRGPLQFEEPGLTAKCRLVDLEHFVFLSSDPSDRVWFLVDPNHGLPRIEAPWRTVFQRRSEGRLLGLAERQHHE
jgi:hypothetical protein